MVTEYRTPGTRLWWSSVEGWIAAAHRIDRRRCSAARTRALQAHGGCLPRAVIAAATDVASIDAALHLLKHGPPALQRPPRGHRADHATTRIIVDLMNRRRELVRLEDSIPEGDNWRGVFDEA